MLTLADIIPKDKKIIRYTVKHTLKGSKVAYLVGDEVIISPAMFWLIVDKDQTVEQRTKVLKSIPCQTAISHGQVYALRNKFTLTGAANEKGTI